MQTFLDRRQHRADVNWRAIVLFGRNTASYKFAFACSLLDFADASSVSVPLGDFARRYAVHICRHMRRADKQGRFASSRFTDACREYNDGLITIEELEARTVALGFRDVIDAFHRVGDNDVPIRFFHQENGSVRLTDQLFGLATSSEAELLADEVEARWRLVETSWSPDIPKSAIPQADTDAQRLWVDAGTRIDLTGVRPALSAYQNGRCFYCRSSCSPAMTFTSHVLSVFTTARGHKFDTRGIWNLVLTCRHCRRRQSDTPGGLPEPRFIEYLHQRNEWIAAGAGLLGRSIQRCGADPDARHSFLRTFYKDAAEEPSGFWEPSNEVHEEFDAP